eukprot:2371862-Amphidinium_carterae.1
MNPSSIYRGQNGAECLQNCEIQALLQAVYAGSRAYEANNKMEQSGTTNRLLGTSSPIATTTARITCTRGTGGGYYASEQKRATNPFKGKNKSDSTSGTTTTFKNRSTEVTTYISLGSNNKLRLYMMRHKQTTDLHKKDYQCIL